MFSLVERLKESLKDLAAEDEERIAELLKQGRKYRQETTETILAYIDRLYKYLKKCCRRRHVKGRGEKIYFHGDPNATPERTVELNLIDKHYFLS